MGEVLSIPAASWMHEMEILSELGLSVGIVTHDPSLSLPDRLMFETEPGDPISPNAIPRAEALRRLFEGDRRIREQMTEYCFSIGAVYRAV